MFESFGIAFHNFDAVYLHDLKLKVVDFKIIFFTFQASQCWRAALEFTTRFLTAHGQGVGQTGQRALHTHKTLQVQNRKLFLTSWYASVKFHMGLVEPWFVFWWQHQMSPIYCQATIKGNNNNYVRSLPYPNFAKVIIML